MFLLDRLLLLGQLCLHPAHNVRHGTELCFEAHLLTVGSSGLQLLLNPLLLLGHQIPSLARKLLRRFFRGDLCTSSRLLPLLRQRGLGIIDIFQIFSHFASVGISEATEKSDAYVGLLQGSDIVTTVATHQGGNLLTSAHSLDNLLFLPWRETRENAEQVQKVPHCFLLRTLKSELQTPAGDHQLVLRAERFDFRGLEIDRLLGCVARGHRGCPHQLGVFALL
mmetsp:Transcript_49803/g.132107  ORF Transcript_49803/g.132107 Transcript_49803/m.132107 type:complete len:223 (+) Transcript_49803:1228-1896(+)